MRRIGPRLGFLIGVTVGLGALFAIGASEGPARSFPKYSATVVQGALVVTDNDRDRLYLYETTYQPQPGGEPTLASFRLYGEVDLNEVGRPELTPKNPKGR